MNRSFGHKALCFGMLVSVVACAGKKLDSGVASVNLPGIIAALDPDAIFSHISGSLKSDPTFLPRVKKIGSGSFANYYSSLGIKNSAPVSLDKAFGSMDAYMAATHTEAGQISLSDVKDAVLMLKTKLQHDPASITPREYAVAFKLLIFHFNGAPSLSLQTAGEDSQPEEGSSGGGAAAGVSRPAAGGNGLSNGYTSGGNTGALPGPVHGSGSGELVSQRTGAPDPAPSSGSGALTSPQAAVAAPLGQAAEQHEPCVIGVDLGNGQPATACDTTLIQSNRAVDAGSLANQPGAAGQGNRFGR